MCLLFLSRWAVEHIINTVHVRLLTSTNSGVQLGLVCRRLTAQCCLSSRYNLFIVMYPLGVVGELLTIYAALPFVRRSGMYSMRLPNKYNVSFDYYYCLIIVMLSYIPCEKNLNLFVMKHVE